MLSHHAIEVEFVAVRLCAARGVGWHCLCELGAQASPSGLELRWEGQPWSLRLRLLAHAAACLDQAVAPVIPFGKQHALRGRAIVVVGRA